MYTIHYLFLDPPYTKRRAALGTSMHSASYLSQLFFHFLLRNLSIRLSFAVYRREVVKAISTESYFENTLLFMASQVQTCSQSMGFFPGNSRCVKVFPFSFSFRFCYRCGHVLYVKKCVAMNIRWLNLRFYSRFYLWLEHQ